MEVTREDAEAFVRHLTELPLDVIRHHVAIHQGLLSILASRLSCTVDQLPNLKFMHAAKLALIGTPQSGLLESLQKLDSARNVAAHEEDSGKFVRRFHEFLKAKLGPQYVENPATASAATSQNYSALYELEQIVAQLRPRP